MVKLSISFMDEMRTLEATTGTLENATKLAWGIINNGWSVKDEDTGVTNYFPAHRIALVTVEEVKDAKNSPTAKNSRRH